MNELPWPVALTLGSFSRKHIFCARRLNIGTMRSGICDFVNRAKWRYVFRNSECTSEPPLIKRRVIECTEIVPASLDRFLGSCSHLLEAQIRRAGRFVSRLPGFVGFTRRWLRKQDLLAELSDKDGVFAIVARSCLNSMIYAELSKPFYRAVSPLSLAPWYRAVHDGLLKLSYKVQPIRESWAFRCGSHSKSRMNLVWYAPC